MSSHKEKENKLKMKQIECWTIKMTKYQTTQLNKFDDNSFIFIFIVLFSCKM